MYRLRSSEDSLTYRKLPLCPYVRLKSKSQLFMLHASSRSVTQCKIRVYVCEIGFLSYTRRPINGTRRLTALAS